MHRIFLLAIAATMVGCSQSAVPQEAIDAEGDGPKRLVSEHLPNPVQVHPKVISGGLPEGEAAFHELQQLGVKTVISVDSAKPDVKTASKYGLRYVHLPHGYDGVPDERVKELAKAVRDLDGSIYIHCHHGRHRSPAAASIACVAAGMIPQTDGLAVLTLVGTSPKYRGLFESARKVKPIEEALLAELDVEFRETVDVPPMAETMVAVDHTHDELKAIAAAGWRTPAEHPDLEPAHQALLLREHFSELLRVDYVQQTSEEFKQLLRDSEEAAMALEAAVREWHPAATATKPPASLDGFAERINVSCNACHQKFRNVPLSQK